MKKTKNKVPRFDPGAPSEWHTVINQLIVQQRFNEAIDALKVTSLDFPDEYLPHLLLGDCYLRTGQRAFAAESLRIAIAANPNVPAWTYRLRAALLREAKDFIGARHAAEAGLQHFPGDATLLVNYGVALIRLGESEAGIANIHNGLTVEPVQLGDIYDEYTREMLRINRLDGLKSDLTAALNTVQVRDQQSPALASIRYSLARGLLTLKQYDELLAVLLPLVDCHPNLAPQISNMFIEAFANCSRDRIPEELIRETAIFQNRLSAMLSLPAKDGTNFNPNYPDAVLAACLVGLDFHFIEAENIAIEERKQLLECGIAPHFLDIVQKGAIAIAANTRKSQAALPWHGDTEISPRVMDLLDAVETRRKHITSPFTGHHAFVDHALAPECFLHRSDGNVCIVFQWSETSRALADSAWLFPHQRILLYSRETGLTKQAFARELCRLFSNLIQRETEFRRHLLTPPSNIAVSEFKCPHIGHYVWNCISGWSGFFRHLGDRRVDYYGVWGAAKLLGSVGELYPTEVQRAKAVLDFRSDDDPIDFILRNSALLFVIKDRHVTSELSQRVIARAYRTCPPASLKLAMELRAKSRPLLLITIRLDNRSWIEQGTGWIELVRALHDDFPRLGVVIDGMNAEFNKGWWHAVMSVDAEQAVANSLVKACGEDLPIFNSIGCELSESLVLADLVDAFVAPIGAGMAKYRWITNRPGVAFSNEFFNHKFHLARIYDRYRDHPIPSRYVSHQDVKDVEWHGDRTRANFSMDWQAPYRLAKELLMEMFPAEARTRAESG